MRLLLPQQTTWLWPHLGEGDGVPLDEDVHHVLQGDPLRLATHHLEELRNCTATLTLSGMGLACSCARPWGTCPQPNHMANTCRLGMHLRIGAHWHWRGGTLRRKPRLPPPPR